MVETRTNDRGIWTEPRWGTCALLTIDMQVDFAALDGAAYVAGTADVSTRLVQLIRAFRRCRRPIFHAVRLYDPGGEDAELCRRDRVRSGPPLVAPGTRGAQPLPQMECALPRGWCDAARAGEFLEIADGEWVFYKPRWSAFYRTRLAERLAEHGVDTLVVAGCNFPNCPSATLFDATERDFRAVVAIDAVSRTRPDTIEWCGGLGVVPMDVTDIDAHLQRL